MAFAQAKAPCLPIPLYNRIRSSACPKMKNLFVMMAATLALTLTGCASTSVTLTGNALKQPLCRGDGRPVTAAIYWKTHWRADQKEPYSREAAALRGIEDFSSRPSCLRTTGVHRLPSVAADPASSELPRLLSTTPAKPDYAILITVKELGPRLEIGIPAIIKGGTEVLIETRVIDTATADVLADMHTLWRNGGTFVIKGVKTLDQDMSAALSATLMPSGPAQ